MVVLVLALRQSSNAQQARQILVHGQLSSKVAIAPVHLVLGGALVLLLELSLKLCTELAHIIIAQHGRRRFIGRGGLRIS